MGNTPNIRFKGFTDDWEQRKLMEVAEYRNGKAHENEINDDGEYIVVNSKFVSTNGEIRKFSYAQNEPLYENEIAFVLSDVPNGRAIARTFLVDKSGKYTLNQRIAGITPHEDTDPYYLYIKMNRNEYFLKFDDGNKQTNLSIKDVLNYEDMYPSYKEQQKIGMYFQQLDHLITLHQRKCDETKKLKKFMLQKMFPKKDAKKPEIRFAGFTNDWEQRKLGDWGDFYYGRSCPKWSVTEDATIPCIRYGELYTKFGAKIDRVYSYTNMPPENLRFSKGTEVLIPRVGENPMDYNHCTWLSMKDVAIGEMISVFNTDNNPLFTATMFNATLQNEFAMRVEGGSVTNLYFEKLKNIDVSFPSIREQEMIAAYFENIDNLITLHQRKSFLYFSRINDWEQRKLNEVAEFNPKSELPDEFEYVDLESVVGTEMISHRTETKDSAPSRAQRLAQPGDVFFQTVRPYQKNNYLFSKLDNNYVFSTGYAQMRPNIDTAFLMSFLQTDSFVKIVLDNCTGTSYPAINSSDLSNLEISLPKSFEEQKKVGKTIISIDNLITLHRRAYYNKKGGLTNVHNDNQQYYAIL